MDDTVYTWAETINGKRVLIYSTKPRPVARRRSLVIPLVVLGALAFYTALCAGPSVPVLAAKWTPTPVPSPTAPSPKVSATPTATSTAVLPTATAEASATVLPTFTPSIAPYPSAPLCVEHDTGTFHTLWNSAAGCHYDHEHGTNPFIPAVAAVFPGFDLQALLGGAQIGHDYPTSPAENTTKHGGFKWQVSVPAPQGCVTGFDSAQYGVDAAVVQFHGFGDLSHELEGRFHSTAALLRQCMPGSSDYGYIFTIQHQDYGQRVAPYQGFVLPYPDNPVPAYGGGFGPYWSLDCVGAGLVGCRSSVQFVRDRNLNVSSTVTSKGGRTGAQNIFNLLWRVRDNYQLLDSSDLGYPFTFVPVCEAQVGCRWNNSTATIHEVAGFIPVEWDGSVWDTDPRVGRVSGEAIINGFPVVLVSAYVGQYGGELSAAKVSNPTPADTPDREIFFCGGVVCAETDAGAVPSGWIGAQN